MKGTLKHTTTGWIVKYFNTAEAYDVMYCGDSLPLHPDDLDSEVIRWLDKKEVEFEIKYYWDGIMEQPIEVAKLIDATKEQTNGERFEEFMRTVEGYPELEGTINLCEDIIEKKTGKMTEEEWQAAENNPKPKYTPGKGISFYIENEISDEEIEKAANEYAWNYQCPSEVKMCKHDIISAWNNAIKWYKEQFKKK
jgi:hypothetical protein